MIFENCAISNEVGDVKMYRVPKGEIGTKYPEWSDGCSTLYPKNSPIRNFELEEVIVKSNTLDNVLLKNNISNFDIIQIDAEGADYEIFQSIDLEKYKPKFIAIEIMHLSQDEINSIKNKLSNNGYRYNVIIDLLAVEENCLNELK